MAKKTNVTRTFGPIHFEDLDPHRFEDLARELIYDFRDWQSIEATGRSGADEGFDIRAYEKAERIVQTESEEDDESEEIHPMEGNLWMIQCKREKEIGPTKVSTIISDAVDEKDPPYGYILVAPANFSKKSYDTFREELRTRGVMEFYLWGRAELEDQLHLPKNDRILFTFFGVSLVSRRRSRATEIRSVVLTKNKLFRIFGSDSPFDQSVLLRDSKDLHYPYEDEYPDFKKAPRWREYVAYHFHPLGVWFHTHKYFAFVDTAKKEWDFTKEVDLVHREVESDDDQLGYHQKTMNVRNVWEFFPRSNHGYFETNGFVQYDSMIIIDDKGDNWYDFPHIYVDFDRENGPFNRWTELLKIGGEEVVLDETWQKIDVFPKKFTKPKIGKVHKKKKVVLDEESLRHFNQSRLTTLFNSDDTYAYLNQRDVIAVQGAERHGKEEEIFVQITSKFTIKAKEYTQENEHGHRLRDSMHRQLGREPKKGEDINVYEFRRFHAWELKDMK